MHGIVHEFAPVEDTVSTDTSVDPSKIKKRSVVIAGHRTSVSLENIFWERLRDLAANRNLSVNQLVSEIDGKRTGNLSSAIRTYVLTASLVA